MISIADEKLITLKEYAKMIPGRDGKPSNLATGHRHAFKGILVDGHRIYLESLKFGGRIYTSVEAAQRFVDRLSEARQPSPTLGSQGGRQTPPSKPAAATIRTAAQRRRDHERAERELEAAGII